MNKNKKRKNMLGVSSVVFAGIMAPSVVVMVAEAEAIDTDLSGEDTGKDIDVENNIDLTSLNDNEQELMNLEDENEYIENLIGSDSMNLGSVESVEIEREEVDEGKVESGYGEDFVKDEVEIEEGEKDSAEWEDDEVEKSKDVELGETTEGNGGILGDEEVNNKDLIDEGEDLIEEEEFQDDVNQEIDKVGEENIKEGKVEESSENQDRVISKYVHTGLFKLEVGKVKDFDMITLGNQPKKIYTSFESGIKVKDDRGTGEGWRIDIHASQFRVVEPTGGFKQRTEPFTIPQGSLAITTLENSRGIEMDAGNNTSYMGDMVIDDGSVTVARMLGNEKLTEEGMKEYNLNYSENALSLVVDATTARVDKINYPNSFTPYETTITWDLVTAP